MATVEVKISGKTTAGNTYTKTFKDLTTGNVSGTNDAQRFMGNYVKAVDLQNGTYEKGEYHKVEPFTA